MPKGSDCRGAVWRQRPLSGKCVCGGVGGGHLKVGVEGKVDCAATNDTSTWQLSPQLPSFPAIFTLTSHFCCREMICVIRADLGRTLPSDEMMDPLFIKDLLFALYMANLKLKSFQIRRRQGEFFSLLAFSEKKREKKNKAFWRSGGRPDGLQHFVLGAHSKLCV